MGLGAGIGLLDYEGFRKVRKEVRGGGVGDNPPMVGFTHEGPKYNVLHFSTDR
jgi:hypothetical protein